MHTQRLLQIVVVALALASQLAAQDKPVAPTAPDSNGRRTIIKVAGTGDAPNGQFSTASRQLGGAVKPPVFLQGIQSCEFGSYPSGFDFEMIDTTKDSVDIRIQFSAAKDCRTAAKPGTYTGGETPQNLADPQLTISNQKLPNGCSGGTGTATGSVTINRFDVYRPRTGLAIFQVGYLSASFTMECGGANGTVAGTIEMSTDNLNDADYILANPEDTPTPPDDPGDGTAPAPLPPIVPPDALVGFPSTIVASGLEMTNDSTQTVTISTITQNGFSGDVDLEVVSDATEAEGLTATLSNTHFGAPGIGQSTLTIRVGPNTFPRDYFVTVITNANGKQAFNTIKVTVLCDPPMILGIDQPRGTSFSGSGSASVETKVIGSGPLTYQWYGGSRGSTNFPVSGGTGAKLTTSNEGLYWVRVSNACGSVDSAAAFIARQ